MKNKHRYDEFTNLQHNEKCVQLTTPTCEANTVFTLGTVNCELGTGSSGDHSNLTGQTNQFSRQETALGQTGVSRCERTLCLSNVTVEQLIDLWHLYDARQKSKCLTKQR